MHGPPLTQNEIVALLSLQVRKLLDLGVDPDRAIIEVAKRHRISPLVVLRLTAAHREQANVSGAAA